jgi:2-succinyl-5-enolpyruvyl-6-hydroxy-3-cyclohexene-1-carboxylate synthase
VNIVNVNLLHAAALFKTLAACGAKRVVISPGSRSTPLALTAHDMPELETYVLTDERAAAFFALGLSKADGLPAILICTSGTAAVNYFPAIVEASQSCVPLIALTADRPISLRGKGAPQTIRQAHLYGDYPRFFCDLPPAQLSLDHIRDIRNIAARACAAALSVPLGPVHVNVPFDEPLAPVPEKQIQAEEIWRQMLAEDTPAVNAAAAPPPEHLAIEMIAQRVQAAMCGLIVCGPDAARSDDEAQAIFRLSRRLGWPMIADILSGLRFFGDPAIPFYDVFLREETLAILEPDVRLTFGSYPVSKMLNAYLDRHRAAHTIRIQPDLRGRDPNERDKETVIADIADFCTALATRIPASRDSLLYEPFRMASMKVRAALDESLSDYCEAQFVRVAVRAMPDHANIILANSLTIRYADALCCAKGMARHTYGLRGASGIDGTVSHALGIAAASQQPSLLICGDLAFLHDLNGLAAARFASNLTILLLNNDGGGIFHFLPVHEQESETAFEAIHGTPHDLNLAAAHDLFHVEWTTIQSPEELPDLLNASAAQLRVIEVRMPRETNAQRHAAFFNRLQKAAVS